MSLIPLFVVPIRNVPTLCAVDGGVLLPLATLPIPANATYALSPGGWVAWFTEEMPTIQRLHIDDPQEARFAPMELPGGLEVERVVFHGDRLYTGAIGPQMERHLGVFECAVYQPVWCPLEAVWEEPQGRLRWPDGEFVFHGGKLIALNSSDRPVTFAICELHHFAQPSFLRRVEIDVYWKTVGAETASAGRSWVAIRGVGYGFGEEAQFISVIDPRIWMERGRVAVTLAHSFLVTADDPVDPPIWGNLAWADNTLLIAAGKHGIGVLPLDPTSLSELQTWNISRHCEAALTYVPLPSGQPGAVIRLHPVPDQRQVLAVIQDDEEFDTILLSW